MNIKNIVFGVFLIVLALLVLYFGWSFPAYRIRGETLPGPKFFPFTLAVVLMIVGAYYIIKSVVMIKKKMIPKDSSIAFEERFTFEGIKNIVAVVAAILFLVPIIEFLGFILGTIIVSSVLMMILNVKVLRSIIYSTILAVMIFLIFGTLFRLPLPEGVIMNIIRG
ncbi:MAG: tripartite tricarboxylate transporter TctB family protein [Mesotoga sp.]|nr:tripartite tricarboxylate transporter TctB family protein [Mesotoga sp.]